MEAKGKVIAIFSTKGGVGKTLIATNLAATLRVHLNRTVAFLDLLADQQDDAVTMLGATDVYKAKAPASDATVPSQIAELRSSFDYVVIDAGSVFSRLAVAAFEHAHLIILVTTPDIIAVRRTNRVIEMFESMQFPSQMLKVIINRAESRGNLRSRELKEQFLVSVLAEIPSDGMEACLSINRGQPLVLGQENSRIKDLFKRLGKLLVDNPSLWVQDFTVDRSKMPSDSPEAIAVNSHRVLGDRARVPDDPVIELKRRVHSRLIEKFDLKRIDLQTLNDPQRIRQLKEQAGRVTLELIAEEKGFMRDGQQRERLVREIVDEALGLGPLEDLVADDDISDILVNGKDDIYIEKHGKLFLTDRRFISNDQVLTVIERIIAPLGRRIDESNPMVDARLPDGSRVNAIIPPLSLKGPMLSIRKFTRQRFVMDDLLRLGTLTPQMAEFLNLCVRARKNIIVSGGTGSGKTTVLNVLSLFIPKGERILTIEDAAELRLNQDHWIPLEAKPPNIEGRGQISIRQLFRNALRMRPDRIIIGECRGDETMDMLQAMNTGHDGSLTTLHANSPQDVISRLDSLVLMSNVDLPVRAIREQIVAAVDLIIHTSRLPDGSRKVTYITEITGMSEQADVLFQDLFLFHQRGLGSNGEVVGEFKPTGKLPTFFDAVQAMGFRIDKSVFQP